MERLWAQLAIRLLGVRLEISGMEYIEPGESYVVVPLHEGFADAAALLHLPLGLRFVAREELAEWKVLGSYLGASRQIVIDPEAPMAAYRRLLAGARRVFAEGDSLVVFAQGTILGIESAFSAGAFRVAEREDRPLLPVVLAGSNRVWEHPFSPLIRFGQTIRMDVRAPIRPENANRAFKTLPERMQAAALDGSPSPRRFVPERDGWWDGYRYDIDPSFADLADRVARHRTASGSVAE
jgi:1-acyl-sn-glycerol-3-phosphate acyltransferase